MSSQLQSRILLAFGALGLLGTIGVQVMGFGSLKGKIETVIEQHSETLKMHDSELRSHDKLIERLNGRMGLSSANSFQRWKADPEEPQQQ